MSRRGTGLKELASVMGRNPQVSLTVRIPEEKSEIWKNIDIIGGSIEKYSAELADNGKVTVREEKTGLISVTVEGPDFERINAIAGELSEIIRKAAG